MNRYHRQIQVAVEAVRFGGPSRWFWLGQPIPVQPGAERRTLLFSLQNQLYSRWYCRGLLARPYERELSPWPVSPDLEPLSAALAGANAGQNCWQSGWLVEAATADELLIARDGLHLHARRSDCRPEQVQPGETVQLRLGKDLPLTSPGFYLILGDAELRGSLFRVYWNLTADGAVPLVRAVTAAFNRAGLPFQLKLLNSPAQYNRCDAAVLYASRAQYPAARELLSALYPQLAGCLREAVPAFAKPLAPGVGLAEDPAGRGVSFGADRCRQLALALVEADAAGRRTTAGRVEFVTDRLEQAGINPDAPFLDPGSSDIYQTLDPPGGVPTPTGRPAPPEPGACLDTAVDIGRRLGADAIWYEDRCTWVGPYPQDGAVRHGTLGPDLYAGTAGVAWFLAELGAATGAEPFCRTALGAIRHALTAAEAGALKTDGLYTGALGVVLAGVRIGQLLGAEEPLMRAQQLLQRWLQTARCGRELDLMSGRAGTIMALLELRGYLAGERQRDGALLDAAVANGRQLSESHRLPYGLAHGAAGVGVALLELAAATDETEFSLGAERVFDRKQRRRPHTFPPAWCRGAAGVALSRLRAFQLTEKPEYREEARAAVTETRQFVEAALRNQQADFSLCHGLTGNAEVLLACAALPGLAAGEAEQVALQVARVGMSRCVASRNPWPCGLGYAETPGLLTGLAGIGLFYLRVHRPELPSILLLMPPGSQ